MSRPFAHFHRKSIKANRRAYLERLESRTLLTGNHLQAVGDGQSYTPYDSRLFTSLDGATYFFAADPLTGFELWRTDGTDAGTGRITSTLPTPDIDGFAPLEMVASGDRLFFTLGEQLTARQLWTSDGTAAGTVLVKEFSPFGATPYTGPKSLTAVDGNVSFTADDGVHGVELWTSDGTDAGTVPVADIRAGALGSYPQNLTALDGKLYFTADDGTHGVELWRSDGTSAGTVLLELRAGAPGSNPANLTVWEHSLYFTADDGVSGIELWRTSDAAVPGQLVSDINPGAGSSSPHSLTPFAGELWFAAEGETGGIELWKTGTAVGTTSLVKDVLPGAGSSTPESLTVLGNLLYFTAAAGGHWRSLWRSDGSTAGTVMAIPEFTGGELVALNDVLLYVGYSGIWSSDGTPAGTQEIQQIVGYNRTLVAPAGSSVAFFDSTFPGTFRFGLWKTDGTLAGTARLNQGLPEFTESVAAASDGVFFSAEDGIGERGLWFSDGTSEGTHRVGTVRIPAAHFTWPVGPEATVVVLEDIAYFTGIDANFTPGLWRSDGTPEGTYLLTNALSSPIGVVRFGDAVYFPSNNGLWKLTDGDVAPEQLWFGRTSQLTPAGDYLFFHTQQFADQPKSLLRTDGTWGGTLQLVSSNVESLVSYHDSVYFFREVFGPREFWTSDGTEEGTARVDADLPFSLDGKLFASGDWLYLLLSHGLFKSDGTAEGTTLVSYVQYPSGIDERLVQMVSAGDNSYFYAAGQQNDGLYRTDGTPAGTIFLAGRIPLELTPVGDQLYFVGTDASFQKRTLWKTDGTVAGTLELTGETYPVTAPVVVYGLQAVGEILFMSATRLDSSSPVSLPAQLWVEDARTPGDANNDGRVDGADYTVWADHFLSNPTSSLTFNQGDFNRDRVVDGADYTLWADYFTPQFAVTAATAQASSLGPQAADEADSDAATRAAIANAVDHILESLAEQSGSADITLAATTRPLGLAQHWLGWLALAADALTRSGQAPRGF